MRVDSRWGQLAARVADGVAVPWEAELFTAEAGEETDLVESLRVVAGVAEVHGMEADGPEPWFWGPLQVLGVLSEGAGGTVYKAKDRKRDGDVALRFLGGPESDPEAERRQVNQARRLARVHHPNVLRVRGVERHGGVWGMWTELVPGRRLEDIVREDGPLGDQEAAFVTLEVCRGLKAVHKCGLLHGNLNPRSILREEEGRPLLADLGPSPVDPVEHAGSSPYLPPELAFGDPPSAQSDLYSLGALLFFLLTGEAPARVMGLQGVSRVSPPPRRLVELRPPLSPKFQEAVSKALSSNSLERFCSAAEFEAVLVELMAGRQTPRSHGARGQIWLVLLLLVLLVVLWVLVRPQLFRI